MKASAGSRLPRGAVIEGALRGSGDLRVAGEVLGPIEIEGHLVIEATGLVRGEVRARTITIAGTLEGDANAVELVRLEAGARMTGDARADRVSAAEGARLRGRIRTSQERAQLERMRRTTGGTLLAPFSSSGALRAPGSASSDEPTRGEPTRDEPTRDEPTRAALPREERPTPRAAPRRATSELAASPARTIDVEAAERDTSPMSRPARAARASTPEGPPPPFMPAIGKRRARRRDAEPTP